MFCSLVELGVDVNGKAGGESPPGAPLVAVTCIPSNC